MHLGRDVVQMVEATELSLSYNCAPVPFEVPDGENRRLPDRRRSFGIPVIRPPRGAARSSAVSRRCCAARPRCAG